MATQGSNGFWLKVVGSLVVAGILAAATVAWSLNGRVTVCETLDKTMGEDIKQIKDDLRDVLRYVKPAGHP